MLNESIKFFIGSLYSEIKIYRGANGSFEEILIQSNGSNYNSPPDILIDGDGIGAVLTPVLEDGTISSITVIEKGEGYTAANTSISVFVPGEAAEFRADIQNWRLNLFQRHIDNFSTDDGIIADQFNVNRGLQYAHLYAPRKLRESVFGTDQEGNILYATATSSLYSIELNQIGAKFV